MNFMSSEIDKSKNFMTSKTSVKLKSYNVVKKNIRRQKTFFEGGHQLEKLEFALAIAQTKGDEKKSIILRKKIVELGGNVEEPGT